MADELQAFTEQILASVEEPFLIQGREIFLKSSSGVAWYPSHGQDAKTVFRCAESALHRSMRQPHAGVTWYHSEMQDQAKYEFDLQSELRQALDNGEIVPWFQPQLSAAQWQDRRGRGAGHGGSGPMERFSCQPISLR